MLDLTDPLWERLDHAYGLGEINSMVAELAAHWDVQAANDLFWGYLCHQNSLYGATYAAVPHLLAMAEPDDAPSERQEIAIFLGAVVLNAPLGRSGDRVSTRIVPGTVLAGLPETVAGWDRKRDLYRSLLASGEAKAPLSDHERDVALPRYRRYVALPAVNESDLVAIANIRDGFVLSLPSVRALCVRALRERVDPDTVHYLLSGIAACDGLNYLATLLSFGPEGGMRCNTCGSSYEYISFGDRMAVYSDDEKSTEDRGVLDYQEGTPSRADGIVSPVQSINQCLDERVRALYELADETTTVLPLLQNLLGEFGCVRCGTRGPLWVST